METLDLNKTGGPSFENGLWYHAVVSLPILSGAAVARPKRRPSLKQARGRSMNTFGVPIQLRLFDVS